MSKCLVIPINKNGAQPLEEDDLALRHWIYAETFFCAKMSSLQTHKYELVALYNAR